MLAVQNRRLKKLPVYGILNYEYTTLNNNIDIMIPTIDSLFNSPYRLKRLKKYSSPTLFTEHFNMYTVKC